MISDRGDTVCFEFSNGSKCEVPVFSEKNEKGTFRYCYVDAPRDALFNDNVQPRSVKPNHLWLIYYDLHVNPLYEAPGCRVISEDGKSRVVMFDGQHKSIAAWMLGRESVVVKVYLEMTRDQAVYLVNSIQSKIGKLPLSPFELAAKMSEEWQAKMAEYEDAVSLEHASEKGFIDWLPSPERRRGKEALRAAIMDDVLSNADFAFKSLVKGQGDSGDLLITENVLKTKVLDRLLVLDPLERPAEEGRTLRAREATNVTRVLNSLVQKVFDPDNGQEVLVLPGSG
ncbi:MAG TPA: hypothetical protein PJ994_03515, partial [Tepidiformaceae bacterium]|nr:hypothetical protein [Tepidiformaceae bacterium]